MIATRRKSGLWVAGSRFSRELGWWRVNPIRNVQRCVYGTRAYAETQGTIVGDMHASEVECLLSCTGSTGTGTGGGGGGGNGENRWYKFKEGSGSTLTDSASAQDGTITGCSWSGDSPTSGGSLYFSGTGTNKVVVPNIDASTTAFSIFGRAKLVDRSGTTIILGSSSAFNGVNLFWSGGGPWIWLSGVGASFGCRENQSIPSTAWHSFAATVNGGDIALYFDGTQVGGGCTGMTAHDNPSGTWQIGPWAQLGANTPPECYITDVRYFTSAIDASAVATLHANTTF